MSARAALPPAELTTRLAEFLRFAHDQGYGVGVRESLDVARLASTGVLLDPRRMYWGLRSIVCQSRDDWLRFDQVFAEFWHDIAEPDANTRRDGGLKTHARASATVGISGTMAGDDEGQRRRTALREEQSGVLGQGGASSYEVLAHRDFRFVWDHEQMQAIEAWVERISERLRRRLRRRYRTHSVGRRLDFRRTTRRSMRFGGWPLELRFRHRRRRNPKLVLFLDVSQSMEVYSYLFLRFARAVARAMQQVEVFAFHTRLVHIGDALKGRDIATVDRQLAEVSSGWLGGTRISASLDEFNRHYGGSINAQSIVLVFSDGCDTAGPDDLATQVRTLKKRAKRVIWVNPLLGRPRPGDGPYPVELGMTRARPYIDLYASAHSLDSLRRLESALVRLC